MGFIIGAIALVVVVLAILAHPWWRRADESAASPPTSAEHLAAELDDDVATGLLAPEDLKPAARDLEATAVGENARPALPRRRWGWSAATLLLVPLTAGVLYWHFGAWRVAFLGPQAATVHQADRMLAELRAHLKKHPDDLQGWINLGEGEELTAHYPAAEKAFGRAATLETQPDANVLAMWGEAQLLANPQGITRKERRIFARVQKLDPNNTRGLFYGGLIALKDQDRKEAIADWRRLLAQSGVSPRVAAIVRQHLSMLGAPTTAAGAAKGHSAHVSVTVRLAPALASRVSPGETLFVFVRGSGGGAPFAVRRLQAKRFPVTVNLSDSDAMLRSHDLSAAKGALEVVARLAPQGGAEPQPGDLVGTRHLQSSPLKAKVTVVIDHALERGGS